MCVQPAPWPEPDPQITAAITAMYGTRKTARPLAVLIRDQLGEWLGDEEFASAFGVRGRPGWSPSRLALVTVLQRAENLTDRLAADAVRMRMDWKYLLGLPLDDPGFDHTVLAEFRARVADAGLEQVALDALLEAVYDPSAPAWLRELPAVDVLRRVLLQNYTRAITETGREVIKRREKEPEGDGLPPGHARIASPYDLDARWGAKREEFWLGCKLHITETCDDAPPCTCPQASAPQAAGARAGESGHAREHGKDCPHLVFPNLITHVATTDATVTGNQMTAAIHDDLARKNLAPGRGYLDSGYLSAELVVSELARHGIALIGPLLADTSAQARAGNGYARADFTTGYGTHTVTCPHGKTAASWTPCTQHGKDAIVATFSASDCGPCPARTLCTTGKRRQLTLLPRNLAEAQAAARATDHDPVPGRLRPPRRRRRHHAPGRQPRRQARPLPRPAQDPPRPRIHGLRTQPPPATGLLDRHPAGPAANQPPGTPRTRPRRIERGLATRITQ